MADQNTKSAEAGLNPNALSPENAAKLMSKVFGVRIPQEHVEADLASGAPRNADGTINLVHYAAWMVKEMGHAD